MVTAVKSDQSDRKDKKIMPTTQSFIIEMVGPAGSGKTTLSRALRQRSENFALGEDIALRKLNQLPVFLRTLPTLLPFFLPGGNSRSLSWDETKAMAFATGWHHIFKQQSCKPGSLVLLDHGPIVRLAMLQSFGPPKLKERAAEGWWDSMFRQWATTLDMIVWLDAPNSILESRINARNQRHPVKGKSTAEVMQFLDRYRSSYELILAKLARHQGPKVLRFDTSQTDIAQIVQTIETTFPGIQRKTAQSMETR